MRIRLLHVTPALLFAFGCASRPAAPPTSTPEASLPIQGRVERVLGSMQVIESFKVSTREKYDDPAAGVRVKFVTAEGLGADVFAYPVESVTTDTSVDQRRAIAIAEATAAVSAIRAYEQSGAYQNVVVAQPTRFDVTVPSGYVAPGAYVSVSLRAQGQPRRSDLYVVNFRGMYIKIRATYSIAAADAGAQKDIEKLLAGVVAGLDSGLGRPATIQMVPPQSP